VVAKGEERGTKERGYFLQWVHKGSTIETQKLFQC
jgi:hypothetical protein